MCSALTDFPSSPPKTAETGKTYAVDNEVFLRMIFGGVAEDTRPILVSFGGNPHKVPKSFWFGKPWSQASSPLPVERNNYFSLSVFRADHKGEYRRRKTQFVALHAVMLDDLGGKIPLERLELPPTWLLETSQGNFQAGFVLEEPLADGPLADRLMDAIVAAGLCDPGANGPRARLARLPMGGNGKHEPPFACRLAAWEPGLRYSVEDLVAGLQLEMSVGGRPKRASPPSASPQTAVDEEAVWIPRPKENPVLTALRAHGLYKSPLGEGKHDITCPWVAEHTNGIDGGTAWFEPSNHWPSGGFKCLHGHCAQRNIRDLLGFLGVDPKAARDKPTIRVVGGEIDRVADAAERELAGIRRFYQRGGLIVTVTSDPGTRETRIQEVSLPSLTRALAGMASWERYDGRSEEWVRTDPPARHVGVLLDATSYPHLPVLSGLAHQPYLRANGSLMEQAGYDELSAMFGVFDGSAFLVPAKPTRAEAEAALALLRELLEEFAFAAPVDEAATMAAMLTAAIRPSLPLAPMFHVRAHAAGSGKSYLCGLIATIASPRRGSPTTFPGGDEECHKLLLAELLRAPAVIEFDNMTTDILAHKSLCAVLTTEFFSGRILGVSKTATVGTRTLLLSSGNNVGPVQDMARRCVTIHLDPVCEVPSARAFKRPHLLAEVMRERARYVSAALIIVRGWIVSGRPKSPCQPLASYDSWSDLCRQPLLWLGLPDPAASVFEAMAEDPDRDILSRLLHGWKGVFGQTLAKIRDAVRRAEGDGDDCAELREVLLDIAGDRGVVNRRKLGWWFRRHVGRIVDGMRLARGTGNASAENWRVEVVESVLPVSTVSPQQYAKTVATTSEAYRHASRGE